MATQREELIVRAGFDNTALGAGLRQAEGMVNNFASSIATKFAATFSIFKAVEFEKSILDWARSLEDASERLNVTVEEIQRLNYAANQTDTSIDKVAGALDRLAKAKEEALGHIGSGTPEEMALASKAFENLGISLQDINSKSPKELFDEIATSIQKTGINSETTASMMALMGRSAGELIPMLKQLKTLEAETPVVSDEDIKKLDQQRHFFGRLGASLKSFGAWASANLGSPSFWKKAWKSGFNAPIPSEAEQNAIFDAREKAADDKANTYSSTLIVDLTKQEKKDKEKLLATEKEITAEKTKQITAGLKNTDAARALAKEIKDLAYKIKQSPFEGLSDSETALLQLQLEKDKTAFQTLSGEMQRTFAHNQEQIDQQKLNQQYDQVRHFTPYIPSVEEMASGGGFMTRLRKQYGLGGRFDLMRGSPFKKDARELETLQYQYAWNILHPGMNSDDFVSDQGARIEQIKSAFSKAGLIPGEEKWDKQLQKLGDLISKNEEIRKALQDTGIKIQSN